MVVIFCFLRYLIDSKWLENWKSYVGITKSKGEPPGPIDNSNLLEGMVSELLLFHKILRIYCVWI